MWIWQSLPKHLPFFVPSHRVVVTDPSASKVKGHVPPRRRKGQRKRKKRHYDRRTKKHFKSFKIQVCIIYIYIYPKVICLLFFCLGCLFFFFWGGGSLEARTNMQSHHNPLQTKNFSRKHRIWNNIWTCRLIVCRTCFLGNTRPL